MYDYKLGDGIDRKDLKEERKLTLYRFEWFCRALSNNEWCTGLSLASDVHINMLKEWS